MSNLFYAAQLKQKQIRIHKKCDIPDYQGETNFDVGLAATRLQDTEMSCIFYVAGHKKGNFNPKTLTKFNDFINDSK